MPHAPTSGTELALTLYPLSSIDSLPRSLQAHPQALLSSFISLRSRITVRPLLSPPPLSSLPTAYTYSLSSPSSSPRKSKAPRCRNPDRPSNQQLLESSTVLPSLLLVAPISSHLLSPKNRPPYDFRALHSSPAPSLPLTLQNLRFYDLSLVFLHLRLEGASSPTPFASSLFASLENLTRPSLFCLLPAATTAAYNQLSNKRRAFVISFSLHRPTCALDSRVSTSPSLPLSPSKLQTRPLSSCIPLVPKRIYGPLFCLLLSPSLSALFLPSSSIFPFSLLRPPISLPSPLRLSLLRSFLHTPPHLTSYFNKHHTAQAAQLTLVSPPPSLYLPSLAELNNQRCSPSLPLQLPSSFSLPFFFPSFQRMVGRTFIHRLYRRRKRELTSFRFTSLFSLLCFAKTKGGIISHFIREVCILFYLPFILDQTLETREGETGKLERGRFSDSKEKLVQPCPQTPLLPHLPSNPVELVKHEADTSHIELNLFLLGWTQIT